MQQRVQASFCSFSRLNALLCFDAKDVDGGVLCSLVWALQESRAGVGKRGEAASGICEREYNGIPFCSCIGKKVRLLYCCQMKVCSHVSL